MTWMVLDALLKPSTKLLLEWASSRFFSSSMRSKPMMLSAISEEVKVSGLTVCAASEVFFLQVESRVFYSGDL